MTPDTIKNKQTLDISGVRLGFVENKKLNPSVPKLSVQIETQGDRSCTSANEKHMERAKTNISISSFEG
jgi:hypothetical protein